VAHTADVEGAPSKQDCLHVADVVLRQGLEAEQELQGLGGPPYVATIAIVVHFVLK
jgi:hypothetical protein